MIKNAFLRYICIIAGVSIALYGAAHCLSILDRGYFQQHKAELTTEHITAMQDGVVTGADYSYGNSPYYYPYLMMWILSVIAPIILVWILSVRMMFLENEKNKYIKSLFISLVYGAITFVAFLLTMDPSNGEENNLAMIVVLAEISFVIISVIITNGTILKFRRMKKIN
ncbi:MAG: hypothetical protein WC457_01340 [Patescibacteria group bacterium]